MSPISTINYEYFYDKDINDIIKDTLIKYLNYYNRCIMSYFLTPTKLYNDSYNIEEIIKDIINLNISTKYEMEICYCGNLGDCSPVSNTIQINDITVNN